ncbi:MAG: hypothetical protein ABI024_00460 [Vicinamibacterales bacterium]
MSEPEPNDVAAADEALQILYWLRGEKLADDASIADLQRFIPSDAAALSAVLNRLERHGLVRASRSDIGVPRYHLTEEGVREGGRRFADEFADITKPGHGECGDPECDCHQSGNPADCAHHHHHS